MLTGIVRDAVLVGGDAAVIRASIMGGLFVTASVLGRRSTALVSLAAACAFMVMRNPLLLWDLGLQMSSVATAGLILLVPPFYALFAPPVARKQRVLQRLHYPVVVAPARGITAFVPMPVLRAVAEEGLIVSMAANVMTMPLILFYFQRLSVVSLLTNLLIVPVQPLIMLGGGLGLAAGILGLAWPARLVLWFPYLGLVWTVGVVQWTASLPGASQWHFGFTPPVLAATYSFILIGRWRVQVVNAVRGLWACLHSNRWVPIVAPVTAGLLSAAVLAVWWAGLSQPDGRLHVWFLDVGQGDGILIQRPQDARS